MATTDDPKVPEQPQGPTIVITLSPNMQVSVAGAIDNKMIAYGMLDCAREAIQEYHRQAESKIIKPAFMGPGNPFSRS